jgi:hypothetical protein
MAARQCTRSDKHIAITVLYDDLKIELTFLVMMRTTALEVKQSISRRLGINSAYFRFLQKGAGILAD